MIELRWEPQWETPPVLQYRLLFAPVVIASGDIVLEKIDKPEWQDVPLVAE